jgi:hypothetical protein
MWSLMGQGRSSSFIRSPRELFVAAFKRSALKAANSGKSFGGRRDLSSSEGMASRRSCRSTRHGSSVCSRERRSRWRSATGSDSRETSNTAGTSSSTTSYELWSALRKPRSHSTRARLLEWGRFASRPGNSCHQSRQPGKDCRPGHCECAGSGVQPSERSTILRLHAHGNNSRRVHTIIQPTVLPCNTAVCSFCGL